MAIIEPIILQIGTIGAIPIGQQPGIAITIGQKVLTAIVHITEPIGQLPIREAIIRGMATTIGIIGHIEAIVMLAVEIGIEGTIITGRLGKV